MSGDLTRCHGKGLSRSHSIRIKQLYLAYPKGATASHLLSWSHWVELLKLDDPLERGIHEQQTTTTSFEFQGTPVWMRRARSNHGEFAAFGNHD